ncbi:MAG: S9 family peptidase [Caldilineaceae bacterium]|nr:S9 family peptidase [Caldilineaceae bacterium]
MPAKRPLSAADLYRMRMIAAYQLAPDGRNAVYALQRVDAITEKKYSNLWIVPTASGTPRPFTAGDHVDSGPVWSPDGTRIAFLSNRDDETQSQLFVIPFSGGEAQRLTDLKGDFGAYLWSPDGRTILCQFRQKDADAQAREADEAAKKLGVVARRITRVVHKWDGQGFLPEERWHLWTIDVATGKATQLTADSRFDEAEPAWSPDGRWIAFTSNRAPDPDLDQMDTRVYVMPATGGEMTPVNAPRGGMTTPVFSPNSERIAFFGSEGTRQFWRNTDLWVASLDGVTPARNVTGHLDICAGMQTLGDSHAMPASAPVWSTDGESLVFQVSRHGSTRLAQIPVSGEESVGYTIICGKDDEVVGQPSFDDEQQRMIYLRGNAQSPGDLFVTNRITGRSRRLTRVNETLLRARGLGAVEEVWFNGPDGNMLQGWIMTPPDFDPAQRYPAVLEIHGGPQLQYGHFFFHEFHYLAGQGYVVFLTNPRGSQGYGNEHVDAIVDDFGAVAYRDLMAWADYVTALPYVDAERVGVTGGSYGGYMTNWIVAHTNRFRAAVTQRSLCNLISFHGTSDFTWLFQFWFGDVPPWENVENYWRQSPLKYVAAVETPTLVVHAEGDKRVSIEQSEQWFTALRQLGVASEFLRVEGESHNLSRAGRTDRRIARLEAIAGWFNQYLKQA